MTAVERSQSPGRVADYTDEYNATRLVDVHGANFKYVPKWGCWMAWTGKSWTRDDGELQIAAAARQTAKLIYGDGLERCRRAALQGEEDEKSVADAKRMVAWGKKSQESSRILAMVRLARSDPRVWEAHDKFDADPLMLTVKNGTLILSREGETTLRPHSRGDRITKLSTVNFVEGYRSDRWEKFVRRILPDDESRYFLQRFIGYSLTGNVGERIFVILHGAGRNGKSLFLKMLQETFGEYAASMPPSLLMARHNEPHPTEVASLFGVRLAFASEVRKGRTFDEEQVKRLTGNDRLKARRMREDFWEFGPTHKLIMAVNHKPKVRDTSDSFWDRAAVVQFTVRIPDEEVNSNLDNLLRRERSGILYWAVDGLRAYHEMGLQPPEAVLDATKEYRHAEDKISQFLDERCTFEKGTLTRAGVLIESLTEWSRKLNLNPIPSVNDLAEALKEKGCVAVRRSTGRFWAGVRLGYAGETARGTAGAAGAAGTTAGGTFDASPEAIAAAIAAEAEARTEDKATH